MERPLSLILICLFALACGQNPPQKRIWNFTLIEMGAWEDGKQWDLFDDRPELYATFEMNSDTWRSSTKSHGSWARYNLNESFAFSSSTNLLSVELLDDDHGSDDDSSGDDSSFFEAILSGLVNDADDRVLKATVEIPEGAGLLELKNDQSYLLIEYQSF